MCCSLIIVLLVSLIIPVHAERSYSHLYISISNALMHTKQNNLYVADEALEKFQQDWSNVTSQQQNEKKAVDEALNKALTTKNQEQKIEALMDLSTALVALEKAENPVDEMAQRIAFKEKFRPAMVAFEKTLASADIQAIETAYKVLNGKWNKEERPVREQDVAMYGEIETKLAFLRISLSAEQPDIQVIQSQYEDFKSSVERFIAGEKTKTIKATNYSLLTLTDLIDRANLQIDDGDYKAAADTLREFITIWPSVEIEISTRNNNLYTKIENTIPILTGELLKSNVPREEIQQQLTSLKTEIQLVQKDTNYSFWDSALILLREGLEALLIILALTTFLKKSGQQHFSKWIYVGAIAGVALSILAALLMSTILQTATVDTNREMMEGYVGLLAAAMMIGVGVWLHNKSSVASWNRYIEKQMGHAISKQSITAMAFISFLSVFREGAETIVFYAGIAPKMALSQFLLGIIVAIMILVVLAVVLLKASYKIPIHKFFMVATILIYALAFKIIGVSIHTLQLTNIFPTTMISGIPVVDSIGFYPTIETINAQLVLLVVISAVIFYRKK